MLEFVCVCVCMWIPEIYPNFYQDILKVERYELLFSLLTKIVSFKVLLYSLVKEWIWVTFIYWVVNDNEMVITGIYFLAKSCNIYPLIKHMITVNFLCLPFSSCDMKRCMTGYIMIWLNEVIQIPPVWIYYMLSMF